MFTALSGMILLGLASGVVGFPLAMTMLAPTDFLDRLVMSSITGIFIVQVVWTVTLGTGEGLRVAIPAIFIIWLVSIALLLIRRRTIVPFEASSKSRIRWIPIGMCVGFFVASPGIQSGRELTTTYNIGSDALGNSIASTALKSGETIDSITSHVIQSTDSTRISEVLDFESHRLYRTLNLQTQVQTEFLIGGLRWGLPSIAATVMTVVPKISIWTVLPILNAYSGLVAFLAAIVVANSISGRWTTGFLYGVSTTVPVALVAALFEGGTSQYFAVPSLLVFVNACLHPNLETSNRLLRSALSSSIILVTYSDLWLLLVGQVMLIAIATILTRNGRQVKTNHWIQVIAGLGLGLAIMGPFTTRYLPYIIRRVHDAGIGGWRFPHWMNPAEAYGLLNALNQTTPSEIGPRSALLTGLGSLAVPVLVALAIGSLWSHRDSSFSKLSASSCLLICLVYLKSRYIDHVSNYQYLKAVSTLVASSGLFIFGLPRVGWHKKVSEICTFGLSAMILVASSNYISEFIRRDSPISISESLILKDEGIAEFFSDINIVAPLEMRNTAMSAYVPFNWFGRRAFGVYEGISSDFVRPLYLLIRRDECQQWTCIRDVNPERIAAVHDDLVLVRICDDSKPVQENFRNESQDVSLSQVVDDLFRKVNGSGVDSSYRPNS